MVTKTGMEKTGTNGSGACARSRLGALARGMTVENVPNQVEAETALLTGLQVVRGRLANAAGCLDTLDCGDAGELGAAAVEVADANRLVAEAMEFVERFRDVQMERAPLGATRRVTESAEKHEASGDVLPGVDLADRDAVVSRLRRELDKWEGKAGYVAAILEAHERQESEVLDAAFDVAQEVRDGLRSIVGTAEKALLALPPASDEPAWRRGVFASRLHECATEMRRADSRLCVPEGAMDEYEDSESDAVQREISDVRSIVRKAAVELDALERSCSAEADAQRRQLLDYFDRLSDGDKAEIVDVLREQQVSRKNTPAVPSEDDKGRDGEGDNAQADNGDASGDEDDESPIAERLWRALPKLRGLEPSPEDASKVFPDPELPSLPTIYVGMLGAISDLSEAVAVGMHYFEQYGPPEDEPVWESDHARTEYALQSAAGGLLALQELTVLLAGTRFRQRLFEFSGTELVQLRTASARLGRNWDNVRAPIVHALNKLIADPEGAHDAWWAYLRGKDDPAVAKVVKAADKRRAKYETAPALASAGFEST